MEAVGFEQILDDDEYIIREFKPNRTRYLTINVILISIISFLVGVGLIIAGACLYVYIGNRNLGILLPMVGGGFVILVGGVIYMIYLRVLCGKILYGYSNKRIIIKTGIIGADYKTISLESISAMNVKVGVIDKWFIRPDPTGNIDFGSYSTPYILNNHNMRVSLFKFSNIDHPYETYKEIKTYIYNLKKENLSK